MFKKIFNWNWLRDNYPFILLVPTLVGGFWQLLELLSIGTAYIRFFSISQVVPDGLMILLLVIIVVLTLKMGLAEVGGTKKESDNVNRSSETKPIPKKELSAPRQYMKLLVNVFVHMVILLNIIRFLQNENLRYDSPLGYMFAAVFALVFLLRMLKAIGIVIVRVHKLNLNVDRILEHEITNSIFAMFYIVIFSGFFFVIAWFHQAFFLSGNMQNQSNFLMKVQTENPGMKVYDILYFNDKYIFVELVPIKGESKILVKEFSEFFESSDKGVTYSN